jgi:hypothetical protein
MCCDSDSGDYSSTMTAASGIDNIGNRAADLSDLQLALGLQGNREFMNLARANVGADGELRDMNLGLAEDLAEQRRTIFDPLNARIVRDAETYDSPDRINQELGRADAAVVQAYDKAARSNDRNMLRMGSSPNSGKALAARENLSFDRAMASATAGNRAIDDLKKTGFGMRMSAAGLGKDNANQQISAANSGMAIGQGMVNSMDRALNSQRDVFTGANNSLGTAASAFGRSGQLYSETDRSRQQANAQDDNITGSLIGAGLGAWSSGACR